MAACIFLFGLFFSVILNFNYIVKKAEEGVAITVFFEENLEDSKVEAIGDAPRDRDDVLKVTYVSADELRLPVILTIENSDGRIAEAVKSNTTKKNQKILAMNSLQSVTKEQIADGITYLQVMQENLSVLSEALN